MRFVKLDKNNFSLYRELIESSEQEYPESLRTDISDYREMSSESDSVCFVLFVDDVYAGNIMGARPSFQDLADTGEVSVQGNIIYVYNLLVLPGFQGKGLGLKLMEKFIEVAKHLDYKFVNGNFRSNGSYRIAKKFNVIYEKKTIDWEGSGEDFVYCVIQL